MTSKIDPRLARMAADLRRKYNIKTWRPRVCDFAAYGIEVPRGQLKAYQQRLRQEYERQEARREEKRRLQSLARRGPEMRMEKNRFLNRSFVEGPQGVLGFPGRVWGRALRRLRDRRLAVLRDMPPPTKSPFPFAVLLPGLYMLQVNYIEQVDYNYYSKRWHAKYGPRVSVIARNVVLARMSLLKNQEIVVFKDSETLASGFRGAWKTRVFESFLNNTPGPLLQNLLQDMFGKPVEDDRGRRFWITPLDNPFGFSYLGYNGKRWILENDLEKALFSTFGQKSVGKMLHFEKGPMRVFQLRVKDQEVGWLVEMGPLKTVADTPEKAAAELAQRVAEYHR